jgi:hypothetical protein
MPKISSYQKKRISRSLQRQRGPLGNSAATAGKDTSSNIGDSNPLRGTVLKVAYQSHFKGNSRGLGRQRPFQTIVEEIKDSYKSIYLKSNREVIGILKINGKEVQVGKNGKAAPNICFHNVGMINQHGVKKNPHAEDWVTSSLRNNFEEDKNKNSSLTFEQYLSSKKLDASGNIGTGAKGQNGKPNKHVFSLKLNYSPCLGCVDTLKGFKGFLDKELENNVLFRVKFLKPYSLASTTSAEAAQGEDFQKSINDLKKAGIPVRLQPEASASKMANNPGSQPVNYSKDLSPSLKDNNPDLYKSWTGLGLGRTKISTILS